MAARRNFLLHLDRCNACKSFWIGFCVLEFYEEKSLKKFFLYNFLRNSRDWTIIFSTNEWFAQSSCGCGWFHCLYDNYTLVCVCVSSFLTLLPSSIDAISCCLMVFYIPVLVFWSLLLILVDNVFSVIITAIHFENFTKK